MENISDEATKWCGTVSPRAKTSCALTGYLLALIDDLERGPDPIRVHPYAFDAMVVLGYKVEPLEAAKFRLNGVVFELDPCLSCMDDVSPVVIRDRNGYLVAAAFVFAATPIGVDVGELRSLLETLPTPQLLVR
jgi:hypothetical protein